MKLPSLALGWLLVLLSIASAQAGAPRLEKTPLSRIEYGFQQLGSGGLAAAVQSWTYQSTLADQAALIEKAKAYAPIEKKLGDYVSSRIVDVINVGGGSTLVFASAQFRNGTLFFQFLHFNSGSSNVVNDIAWSVNPLEVWPEEITSRLN